MKKKITNIKKKIIFNKKNIFIFSFLVILIISLLLIILINRTSDIKNIISNARIAYDNQSFNLSKDIILNGLNKYPSNYDLNFLMVKVDIAQKNYDLAEKNLINIIKNNPNIIEAKYELIFLYISKNDPDSAKSLLYEIDSSLKLPLSFTALGYIEAINGNISRTIELLEKSDSLNNDNIMTIELLGRKYIQQNRFQDCLSRFEENSEIKIRKYYHYVCKYYYEKDINMKLNYFNIINSLFNESLLSLQLKEEIQKEYLDLVKNVNNTESK